jgi:hypothetical protein
VIGSPKIEGALREDSFFGSGRSVIAAAVCIALGLLMAPGAPAGDADTAAGTLKIGGKTYKLTNVSARKQADPTDKSKQIVWLLVTDGPVPKSALDDPWHLELTDLAREGKFHGVSVRIGMDKKPGGGFTYAKELGGAIVSRPDHHKFEPAVFTDSRVEGKLSQAEPGKFGDETWTYEVTVKAAVTPLK